MQHLTRIKVFVIAAAAWLGAGNGALADETVRIRVHAEHAAGRVVYHYQIENRGRTDLRQVILGCDCRPAEHVMTPLLETVPVGAQYGDPNYIDGEPTLPSEYIRTPPGWQVHANRPPAADRYWLEWHAVGTRGLAPGQVAKGFSVALPRADRTFLIGRYTVPERNGVGTLEPLDATPPRLALRLDEVAPLSPGDTVRVRVVATIEDDYDPAPRLAFESFIPAETTPAAAIRWSRNGAPSRTPSYTVTYSATDASGNAARASIKVRIPTAAPGGGESVMLPTARSEAFLGG